MANSNFKPRYELVFRTNPMDPSEKKWFAKAVSNGTVELDTLVKTISNRCTVTRHDAKAVLSALQEVISEYIAMGCSVHLEDLGYFRLELRGKGAARHDDFTPQLITNTFLRFLPSEGLKRNVKNLTDTWVSNGIADTDKTRAQYAIETKA